MSAEENPDRSVTIYEMNFKWLLERNTMEEKIAALEVIDALAFPENEDKQYVPPAIPTDGSTLSPCDRARRDAYNIFSGVIKSQKMKKRKSTEKDPVKVAAGRVGGYVKRDKYFGKKTNTESDSSGIESDGVESIEDKVNSYQPQTQEGSIADKTPLDMGGSCPPVRLGKLTPIEESRVQYWDKTIPNAKALHEWIVKNYSGAFMLEAKKDVKFSEYAFPILSSQRRWMSVQDHQPYTSLIHPLQYLLKDYKSIEGTERRFKEEEKRKDREQESRFPAYSEEELDEIVRKRRAAAERETAEKIKMGKI